MNLFFNFSLDLKVIFKIKFSRMKKALFTDLGNLIENFDSCHATNFYAK